LRLAHTAPPPKNAQLREAVRAEFRKNAKEIKRSDFRRIEHLVRQGEKQLKTCSKMPIAGFRIVAL